MLRQGPREAGRSDESRDSHIFCEIPWELIETS